MLCIEDDGKNVLKKMTHKEEQVIQQALENQFHDMLCAEMKEIFEDMKRLVR
jgi:hypothetical protein